MLPYWVIPELMVLPYATEFNNALFINRRFSKRMNVLLSLSMYLKRLIVVAILLTGCCLNNSAQTKQTEQAEQVWLGYLNQTRLSNTWGIWVDAHLRTKDDFVKELNTGIFRTGLTYYMNDDLKFTAGYAFINHFPGDNHKNISQPEHRPWQQVQWHTKYPRLRLMQYIRLEERWRRKVLNDDELTDGYTFNFKFRYNFLAQFPLGKIRFQPRSLSLVLNDEVHVNFGKQIVYNYFDQNRFFTGLNYQLSGKENLQVGYLYVFQQLGAGNRYKNIHGARIFYFQNLDLRKKK